MKQYQEKVDAWARGLKEPYWPPLSQFTRLVEEVGELGRLLNHIYGSKPKKPEEAKQELGEEIGDVLFALICLANTHGISLDEELENVLLKAKTRDATRFKTK